MHKSLAADENSSRCSHCFGRMMKVGIPGMTYPFFASFGLLRMARSDWLGLTSMRAAASCAGVESCGTFGPRVSIHTLRLSNVYLSAAEQEEQGAKQNEEDSSACARVRHRGYSSPRTAALNCTQV